jgi:Ca2+-binding RTX toxin-like protein
MAINGTEGNDQLVGTESGEMIAGKDGADFVDALGGADRVYGGLGDDELNGGSGGDTLRGRAGNDRLFGGVADPISTDTLYGGDGNDTLFAGGGRSNLQGQRGNDILVVTEGTGSGGGGNDEIIVLDFSAFDPIAWSSDPTSAASVSGGAGADTFEFRFQVDADSDAAVITDFNVAQGDRMFLSIWIDPMTSDNPKVGDDSATKSLLDKTADGRLDAADGYDAATGTGIVQGATGLEIHYNFDTVTLTGATGLDYLL